MCDEEKKEKAKSRWVRDSGIPRYDKAALAMIMDKYVESPEWRHGAKVVPYQKQEVKSK